MPSGKNYKPTREHRGLVAAMAGYGIRQPEIASVIGIEQRALRRHYRRELDEGSTKADAKVLETLYKMATSGTCVAATIFWVKVRRSWRESADAVQVNVTATNVQIDASTKALNAEVRTMPDDALKALTEVLGRLLPKGAE